MWRSNSSVSSRTDCPPDIINEEDQVVKEREIPDFRRWNIPKVNIKTIYNTTWHKNTGFSQYRVRTVEQTFSISRHHEKCCLFSKKNINEFLATKLKYLHIGLVQVAVKPLIRKGINASALMCLRDARFKKFKDSILGMITASLYDGPIYFDIYPDICLALDDPNIVKALTLNVLTSGYDMDEDAKIEVPKMISWEDVNLPKEWLLENVSPPAKPIYHETNLTNIQQYLDGTVKISFHDDKPLRINEGRHSFAGSESV
ncbi:hypothetical protein SO802_033436 [Lithocarpus litseifolius]|uniref:Uncharacterized protein n=1 Tax=Lithocarpus litseifolius TaxID=425828 RepID=A0AAW2BCX3_9ROSI